ncbi:unnamed protein product [Chrysoparadoxa australica]
MPAATSRVSISLPHLEDTSHTEIITSTLINSLSPYNFGDGKLFLQPLNETVTLRLGDAVASAGSAMVLELTDGRPVLSKGQEITLTHRESSAAVNAASNRFDFDLVLCDQQSAASALSTQGPPGAAPHEEASSGTGNGHTFGELRPAGEWSLNRQEALVEALDAVGVNANKLSTDGAYFGSSALKTYNTFIRPRASQLEKVAAEPLEVAAHRTAHSIAFLLRRLEADRAEFLRNKDRHFSEMEKMGLTPHPLALVLDSVRSAYNVGSIFRCADTARVSEVVTCGFTPHPQGPGEDKVRKTAFGSVESVESRHFENVVEALTALREEGYRLYALETTSTAKQLFECSFPKDERVAFVLGNEVTGVSTKAMGLCDGVVEVPVYGMKNSLNVCSAAAVTVYETLRQWYQDSDEEDGESSLTDEVEDYASSHSSSEPAWLEQLRAETARVYPQASHMVSGRLQGRLLAMITRMSGAERVLEIGTFTGYSAQCFAESLPPDGLVVTCEHDTRAAEMARKYLDAGTYSQAVDIRLGPAMSTLDQLLTEKAKPFDIVFIDGDKKQYLAYYRKVLESGLLAEGGYIIADNVLFKGMVFNRTGETEGASSREGVGAPLDAKEDKKQKRWEAIADSLDEFNRFVAADEAMELSVMLPLRDGLTIAKRRVVME